MSRRQATRAVTATAGVALVVAGGFGLLNQPSASAQVAPACNILTSLLGCTSTSSAPTTTATAPISSTAPATEPAAPTSTLSVGGPTPTYVVGPTSAAPAAVGAPPVVNAPGPNLRMSDLVIRKSHGKLDVITTVSNTGTVPLSNVGLTVSASGEHTQQYVLTLNAGQHIRFHTRWRFKAAPTVKKVVAVVDPAHRFAETTESDNRVSARKRLR